MKKLNLFLASASMIAAAPVANVADAHARLQSAVPAPQFNGGLADFNHAAFQRETGTEALRLRRYDG